MPLIVLYRIGASTANLINTCSNHFQNLCYIFFQCKIIFYFSFILYYYDNYFFYTKKFHIIDKISCHIIVSKMYTKCFADPCEILLLSKHITEKLAFKVHALVVFQKQKVRKELLKMGRKSNFLFMQLRLILVTLQLFIFFLKITFFVFITAQKLKFSITDFLSKCNQNVETADWVVFTEKPLN